MVDAAKLADLVLLVIDGSYGFEMETFEFLNVLRYDFQRSLEYLQYLDHFSDPKNEEAKKTLKSRFWSEIYHGAKLFYLRHVQWTVHHARYLESRTVHLDLEVQTYRVATPTHISWKIGLRT